MVWKLVSFCRIETCFADLQMLFTELNIFSQVWCNNSRLPVDNVLGGAFESAMRVRLQILFKTAVLFSSNCCSINQMNSFNQSGFTAF